MKLIAFNGSPRKKWNTATLLSHALAGAKAEGARTKLIHLYDLDYKGCTSCFACKRIGGKSYGRCLVNDDLKRIFRKSKKRMPFSSARLSAMLSPPVRRGASWND